MRDYGSSHGDRALSGSHPLRSGLAVTIGSIVIVPAILSFIGAVGRLRRVERLASGRSRRGFGLIGLLVGGELMSFGRSAHGASLAIAVFGYAAYIAASVLIQSRLNAVWRSDGADRSDAVPSELARSQLTTPVGGYVEEAEPQFELDGVALPGRLPSQRLPS
jgi:hypothetical protein